MNKRWLQAKRKNAQNQISFPYFPIIAIIKKILHPLRISWLPLLILASTIGEAQNNVLGGWHIGTLFYLPAEKMVLYGETQARSEALTNNFFYYEIKGGIGYYFQKRNYILFGLVIM